VISSDGRASESLTPHLRVLSPKSIAPSFVRAAGFVRRGTHTLDPLVGLVRTNSDNPRCGLHLSLRHPYTSYPCGTRTRIATGATGGSKVKTVRRRASLRTPPSAMTCPSNCLLRTRPRRANGLLRVPDRSSRFRKGAAFLISEFGRSKEKRKCDELIWPQWPVAPNRTLTTEEIASNGTLAPPRHSAAALESRPHIRTWRNW
jgi:hypothetical protein